jgi:hypothetical protein
MLPVTSRTRVAKEGHPAGDETAAQKLAGELGYLPLALEQAASFLIDLRRSFDQYREHFGEARPELLNFQAEGGTYPASIAKTWGITLDRLCPLARALLRLAAWLAPDDILRGILCADHHVLAEVLGKEVTVSDFAVDKALGELARFSLIRLTDKTVSVHQLLQAVEQDALSKEECARCLEWAVRLFNAFAPELPSDIRTWNKWILIKDCLPSAKPSSTRVV